jgi:WD40 repeat protein
MICFQIGSSSTLVFPRNSGRAFMVCLLTLGFAFSGGAQNAATEPPPAAKPELLVQTGHDWSVLAVSLSPDGRWLASGGKDSLLLIWNVATGQQVRNLGGQGGRILNIAFMPDSRRLVFSVTSTALGRPMKASGMTVPQGNEARMMDIISGQTLWTFNYPHQLQSVALSADGKLVAATGYDKRVYLVNAETGSPIRDFAAGAKGWMETVAFSNDGRLVAAAGPGEIKVWETATGKLANTLSGHEKGTRCVALDSTGAKLVSGGNDNEVKVWDVVTGKQLSERRLPYQVQGVRFNPDGSTFAASTYQQVALFNATTGQPIRTLPTRAFVFGMDFDNTGKLAAGGDEAVIHLWDVNTGKELNKFGGRIDSLREPTFTSDGRWLGSAAIGPFHLWDTKAGVPVKSLQTGIELADTGLFSPNGKYVAVGSSYYDQNIKIWQTGDWRLINSLKRDATPPQTQGERVLAMAFSPVSDQLAFAAGNTIHLGDIAGAQPEVTFSGHTGRITDLAFSPDGQLLASTAGFVRYTRVFDYYGIERDTGVRVWDVAKRNQIQLLDPPHLVSPLTFFFPKEITCSICTRHIAFSKDGQWLAGSLGNKLRIWNTRTWKEENTFEVPRTEWTAVAWDATGVLAAGTSLGAITFWDLAAHKEWHAIESTIPVDSIRFTPDGRWLLSAGVDGSLRLWEVATGELRATLISQSDGDDWLVVAPDGLFDGSPRSWNQTLWRFQGSLDTLPVEVFFNEFFYPGLLANILAGRNPHARTAIDEKDRRQPRVEISVRQAKAGESAPLQTAKLQIKVADTSPDAHHPQRSGVRDVRLFRNGSLVGIWHGDVALGSEGTALLEKDVSIVAGSNTFTAYAFNHDNVKSSDATLVVQGPESLKRKPSVYLLVIGIDQYSNPAFNLRYATDDAGEFASVLKDHLEKLGGYSEIRSIPLLNERATKNNILWTLRQLAGTAAGSAPQGFPSEWRALPPAKPDDVVFIYFAGHGTAEDRKFYLLPHDLGVLQGSSLDAAAVEEIVGHSISDEDLEDALEGLDASAIVLVIDACRSGQALQADDPRQGPMNSKGLAQLAYDKGMYILAASQSNQDALEFAKLGHGLLSYTLINSGLSEDKADFAPKDGRILLREWFDYAVQTVPQLQREAMTKATESGSNGPVVVENEQDKPQNERSLQRPRAFYRREQDREPLVVSRTK